MLVGGGSKKLRCLFFCIWISQSYKMFYRYAPVYQVNKSMRQIFGIVQYLELLSCKLSVAVGTPRVMVPECRVMGWVRLKMGHVVTPVYWNHVDKYLTQVLHSSDNINMPYSNRHRIWVVVSIFFMFMPIWGNDPIWLIFFRWVETVPSTSCWYLYHNVFCCAPYWSYSNIIVFSILPSITANMWSIERTYGQDAPRNASHLFSQRSQEPWSSNLTLEKVPFLLFQVARRVRRWNWCLFFLVKLQGFFVHLFVHFWKEYSICIYLIDLKLTMEQQSSYIVSILFSPPSQGQCQFSKKMPFVAYINVL